MKNREELVKKGDISSEDVDSIKENVSPFENVELIAGVEIKEKGKFLTVITNRRIFFFKRGEFKLVGEHEGIRDFPLKKVEKMNSEPRNDFDLFQIELESSKSEKFMIPKESGGEIAGTLRDLQTRQEKEETPLKKLEKLAELKDKGKISEKEFENKKDKLLKEI